MRGTTIFTFIYQSESFATQIQLPVCKRNLNILTNPKNQPHFLKQQRPLASIHSPNSIQNANNNLTNPLVRRPRLRSGAILHLNLQRLRHPLHAILHRGRQVRSRPRRRDRHASHLPDSGPGIHRFEWWANVQI